MSGPNTVGPSGGNHGSPSGPTNRSVTSSVLRSWDEVGGDNVESWHMGSGSAPRRRCITKLSFGGVLALTDGS
jgi:hypothetical protein